MKTKQRTARGMGSWVWLGALTLLVLAAGCGEQDLYKPPKAPYSVVGRLALPASAQGVCVLGTTAYIAGGQAGLILADIADPSAPRLLNMINTDKGAVAVQALDSPGTGGITRYAFVADGTEGVAIFDVTRPDSVSGYPVFDTFDARGLLTVVPDLPSLPYSVYVADSWRGVWRLDSIREIPGSLFQSGRSYTRGAAQAMAQRDGFIYVADDEMGVAVLDGRTPASMAVVSSCDTPGNALGIDLEGDYAFVADGKDGLVVMSIHQGDVPVIVAHLALAGDCRAIQVRDHRAFIAAYDGGTHFIDLSDPRNPVYQGTIASNKASGVALAGSGALLVSDEVEGLLVLGGAAAPGDATAPGAVEDLTATPRDSTSVILEWTAPGNDLFSGTAASYDIRYSLAAISEQNWSEAARASGAPAPSPSGRHERFAVTGLAPHTTYFFALKTADGAANLSLLSNVPTAATFQGNVPPSLTNASFDPPGAEPGAPITFQVTYTDPDGDPPVRAEVVVSGTAYPMTGQSQDYAAGVVYRSERTFAKGFYEHHFVFDDGREHTVSTAVAPGPWIGQVVILGSPASEAGRDLDEDQHLVALQWQVRLDSTEVTQAEYSALMGRNPSRFQGANRPVENVTWFDAVSFCNARSLHDGLTPAYTIRGDSVAWNQQADGYRLPTEAEWEWACRAGTTTPLANGALTLQMCVDDQGSPDPTLSAIGWYCGNSGNTTHDVRALAPNPWGLYDMHGNVWEWCWDWYSEKGTVGDPTGPARGSQRVIRGGSWYYYARECRSASRAPYWPTSKDDVVGFRLARTIGEVR